MGYGKGGRKSGGKRGGNSGGKRGGKKKRKPTGPLVVKNANNRWSNQSDLLSQAKKYCNESGLVVKRIPSDLFDKLKSNLLVVCGGDLFEPNVDGLHSRWWVTMSLESRHKICSALASIEQKRGIKPPRKLRMKSRFTFGRNPVDAVAEQAVAVESN